MKPKPYEKPKPIFPWEERALPPTRLFVEDLIPESEADPDFEQAESVLPDISSPMAALAQATPSFDESVEKSNKKPPQTPVRQKSMPSEEPWQDFIRASNVWDSVPGINTYVRAVKDSQEKLKKPVASNIGELNALQLQTENEKDTQRIESLVLTDFPTEIERPSLPVTPAPIQRPVFWGDEREATFALPPAEGVPSQADWVCSCPRCGFSSRMKSFCPYFFISLLRLMNATMPISTDEIEDGVYDIRRASYPPLLSFLFPRDNGRSSFI